MGCGSSKALELAKTELANKTMVSAQGLLVDGLSGVDSLTVASGNVTTSDGNVVLSAAEQERSVTFADLSTGKVVVRVDVELGNFFSGKKTVWHVWAAKPATKDQQLDNSVG
eukprot:372779-Prymnesium_polylepis.1